jgi:putative transposase
MIDDQLPSQDGQAEDKQPSPLSLVPEYPPPPYKQETPIYLLSGRCHQKAAHLETQTRRRELLDRLLGLFGENDIKPHAWVVLPDHYHILAAVDTYYLLGDIFRLLHGGTSSAWNRQDNKVGRKIWDPYTDRILRTDRRYFRALNYLHYNPVVHGYADSPYDWVESSLHWYLSHMGRQWLRQVWVDYPPRNFGHGWDD